MNRENLRYASGDAAPGESLDQLKEILAKIKDPEEREIAEAALLNKIPSRGQQTYPVIVLIHGINTDAEWQERVADQLRENTGIETVPIGFGKFGISRFLFPFFFRNEPIKLVTRELRNLKTLHPNGEISVIAHSFGTYILSKILENETDLRFKRIQLCGAVIDTEFRWDKVSSRFSGKIVNDVGSRDLWPLVARISTWGYGDSGTFGFKKSNVHDRHFDYCHSDFMEGDHVANFWKPWIVDGQIKKSKWTSERKPKKISVQVLRIIPLKIFLWILLPLFCFYKIIIYFM